MFVVNGYIPACYSGTNISISSLSDCDALRCLPARLAAISLFLASSLACAASLALAERGVESLLRGDFMRVPAFTVGADRTGLCKQNKHKVSCAIGKERKTVHS